MQHASPSARSEYVQCGRRTQRSAVHVSHVTWASAALWRGEGREQIVWSVLLFGAIVTDFAEAALVIPPLRLAHQEIAECLHARDRLELFGIDEVRVERDRLGFAEQLHEAAVLLHQIIRQHCDAEAALAGAQDAQHVVDAAKSL